MPRVPSMPVSRRMAACVQLLTLAIALLLPAEFASGAGSVVRGTIQLRDSAGAPIARRDNVVVLLEGAAGERGRAASARTHVISQRGRQFTPRVLPIVVGSTVEFPNDDDIYHNVFSLARVRPFDLGIYPRGSVRAVRFDQPGLVPVHCNMHPDMVSYVLVLPTPHFALTDDAGRYEIRGAPAGQYTLRTWDELAPEFRRTVTVARDAALTIDITLQRARTVAPHVNKHGRRYREKY